MTGGMDSPESNEVIFEIFKQLFLSFNPRTNFNASFNIYLSFFGALANDRRVRFAGEERP